MKKFNVITKDNICDIYKKYQKWYSDKLKSKGVYLYTMKNKDKVSAELYTLLSLYNNINVAISETVLTDHFKKYMNDGKDRSTLQIRQVKGNGYDVRKTTRTGKDFFLGSLEVREGFSPKRRDESELTEEIWKKLKEDFDFRCATCGGKEGTTGYKRKNTEIIVLEKGHCDPEKPHSYSNTIPQCRYCNGIYRGWWVFDQEGNIKDKA